MFELIPSFIKQEQRKITGRKLKGTTE